MAGELNFGLLDLNGPAKIGNAFYQGQQEAAQLQSTQNQNKLAAISLQDHQRALNDQTAMTTAIRNNVDPATGQVDHQGVMKTLAQNGSGHLVQQYYNNVLANQKTVADVSKSNADTATTQQNAGIKANEVLGQTLGALAQIPGGTTPEHVNNAVTHLVDIGVLKPELGQKIVSSIPQDPAQIPDWLKLGQQRVLSAQDQTKYTTPDANTVANNATTIKKTAMKNTTSSANTNANIKKDLTVAGMGPNGVPDADTQAMVDAIGQYKVAPPNGMAQRNPRMQAVMAQVAQKYPEFDATTYQAKQKAAKDFTSGNQGNAMRSFAVAGQHLDQLGQLVDALDNGNTQLVNKIGNAYSQQTGNPAVTNFDAAKDVVSKEVVKAIVAGGGGVAEREELSKLMSNAKSPAQLKGVISQYRNLMAAQHEALLQQRRGAGLSDSTLPGYTDASGSPAKAAGTPQTNAQGWVLHVDAKGNKAYVSPDGKQYQEVQ